MRRVAPTRPQHDVPRSCRVFGWWAIKSASFNRISIEVGDRPKAEKDNPPDLGS
jgi:hypothetical protein